LTCYLRVPYHVQSCRLFFTESELEKAMDEIEGHILSALVLVVSRHISAACKQREGLTVSKREPIRTWEEWVKLSN
jgi:hypothetical protein